MVQQTFKVIAILGISLTLFGGYVNAKDRKESEALDLSLHWKVKQYALSSKQKNEAKQVKIQGIFESKEEKSNIKLDAHFERPHKENKDREVTPDGLGVGLKLRI